jgi:hypothetical protein
MMLMASIPATTMTKTSSNIVKARFSILKPIRISLVVDYIIKKQAAKEIIDK